MEDVQEEVSSVRLDILDNTAHIQENVATIQTVSEEVSSARTDFDNATTVLSLAILDNTDHIDLIRRDVTNNEAHINLAVCHMDENRAYLEKLLIRGAQCAYQHDWTTSSSTITYERLLLDTGRGSLSTSTGEYKAEVGGLYQVTWSLHNYLNSGEHNLIYLYKNGGVV